MLEDHEVFRQREDLLRFVTQNCPEVTDSRIDESHWNLECGECKMTRSFQLTARFLSCVTDGCGNFCRDSAAPITYEFRCPACTALKQWILYEVFLPDKDGKSKTHYFRVASVPSEMLEDR